MKTFFDKFWYVLNMVCALFAYAAIIYYALIDCDVTNQDVAKSILMAVLVIILTNKNKSQDEN